MFDLSALGIEYGSLVMFGLLVGLLVTGMPLAFVTSLVALVFTVGWFGPNAVPLITSRIYSFITSYVFIAVPMFVLMAAILDQSNIARDLFNAMRIVAGRLRGGVAIQTLVVALFLAAMSGIIGGETVLLGILALPQMLRLGYNRSLAIGTVCGGGALGTMMPPSIVLIIYGLMANVSIGALFTSAFVPAFILCGFYIAYVLIRCYINHDMAPLIDDETAHQPLSEKLKSMKSIILPVLVAFSVLGSIYLGVASVTEASGIGVVGMLLSTAVRRELTWDLIKKSVWRTLETCGMIIWIGIGASVLVGVYNLMGGDDFVHNAIVDMGGGDPLIVLLIMMGILLVLGMFLDWVGVAMLTMPIFVPIVVNLGFDPVWFGVLFCMNMQVSFLTPPFGPSAFYLKSVAPPEITLGIIFRALVPFIIMQVAALALLIAFPDLAIWWMD